MNTTTNANEKKIEDPKILYVIIIVLFLAFVLGFGGTFIYRTVND